LEEKTKEIIYSLTEIERKLLRSLAKIDKKEIELEEAIKVSGLTEAEVSRAVLWLENKGVVQRRCVDTKVYVPTKKAYDYQEKPLPESRLLELLKTQKKIPISDLPKHGFTNEEIAAALGTLLRMGLIKTVKENGKRYVIITDKAKSIKILDTEKAFRELLSKEGIPLGKESSELKLLMKRGLVRLEAKKKWILELSELGRKVIAQGIPEIEFIEQITPEIIVSREWERRPIRWYDVEAWAPKIWGGRKNPLKLLAEKIRRIFISMGFREMRSSWVDMEFWCFDSMWIPQDHPAREMQSTFWLAQPNEGTLPDKELVAKIKEVQETGGTGSTGWKLPWDEKIARRCILRTHTTATTFRVLGYAIRTGKLKPPVKFFAIGRVFRNETIDWKHLCEFHQIEGFVIAPNLTLRSLMGYIKEFYMRMGIKKIRFKPTYNPYTEPSMEIFAWHEKNKRWVEVGNSGMFRPESLEPYGVKWPTIAWGLALERLAMLIWNIEDIRKILGPSVELDWLRNYQYPQKVFG